MSSHLGGQYNVFYKLINQDFTEAFNEISLPIHLFVDPNTMLPRFPVNKLIDKQVLGNTFELEKIVRIQEKGELIENKMIHETYHAEFTINCR